MNVIGFTDSLRMDADRQCGGRFRAWMGEVRKLTWKNWPELQRYYPDACRTEGEEAHFPLAADGTGIRATVIFKPGLMRLLRIAPAPAGQRQPSLSHPHNQHQPCETQTTL